MKRLKLCCILKHKKVESIPFLAFNVSWTR